MPRGTSWMISPQVIIAAVFAFLLWPARKLSLLYSAFMVDKDPLDFSPPPLWLVKILYALLRILFPVKCSGLEIVIAKKGEKILLVGNHLLYGMDLVLLIPFVYVETGIYIRGIGDHMHFKIPVWRQVLEYFGAVDGTAENVHKLMSAHQPVAIFPGGAEEAMKDERVPKYTLVWKDRIGFARLAIQHRYSIIPFGIVGFEDMVRIAFSIPARPLLKLAGDPRANGKPANVKMHPTSIPPPIYDLRLPVIYPYISFQMSYLCFDAVIDTAKYKVDDKEQIYALRNKVRDAVQGCVTHVRQTQFVDPNQYRIWRVLGVKKQA